MIIKLSDKVANRIAAGEVVTRPNNVLKELVENAIDAEATEIIIDLKQSGMDEITVIDNGNGISKEDLPIAFFRHATSKIKSEFDLDYIKTLGFRGEAIPAIASVSKMLIKSNNGKTSHEIYYEGGKYIHDYPTAINKGTSVTVKDLFYNVPARLKQIKNYNLELAYLSKTCDAFILANPHLSFKVYHNNKLLKQSYGNSDYTTIFYSLFGKELSENIVEIDKKVDNVHLKAYLGDPKFTKSRKEDIYVVLNGRLINNYLLTNALIDGYSTMIMTKRYPVAVIFINVDISLVDVNIHPQKREVKITNEYQIANLIKTEVRNIFIKKHIPIEREIFTPITTEDYIINELELSYNEEPFLEVKRVFPEFDYIGQYRGTYLLFQNDKGLYLIDQHAAEERIRYEIYYEKLGQKGPSKNLLFPLLLTISQKEEIIIKTFAKEINDLGFLVEPAGHEGIFLKSLPIWLDDNDIDDFMQLVILSLEKYQSLNLSDLRDNLSKSIACKGAIKANKPLSIDEVHNLIENLKLTANPYYCPHGRPVMIFYSSYEVEKWFKRVV